MQQAIRRAELNLLTRAVRPTTRNTVQQFVPSRIKQFGPLQSASFLHDDRSLSSSSSKNQTRESWLTRRKRQRNARKKISTLALDHNSTLEPEAQEAEANREHQHSKEKGDRQTGTSRLMTRRQRRLLLWTAVLTMPLWGRDIVQSVVPGSLGVLIFIAGNVKKAISWVRSPWREEKS